MIYIGLSNKKKVKIINDYISENNIQKTVYIYGQDALNIKADKTVDFEETIMYRTFYPLLEYVDKDTLIIIDEFMRTSNQNDLHYNCVHKYLNQTEHRLIFEFFPFIEEKEDFMILKTFDDYKYHHKKFDSAYLIDGVVCEPYKFKIDPINVIIPDKAKYYQKQESLFKNLGQKDPNTIPRNMEIEAGNYKKNVISNEGFYLARNKRFKKANVHTYEEVSTRDYTVLDFHYQRLKFNDFLKKTRMKTVKVVITNTEIDDYYLTEFTKWKARLYAFYELQTSLSAGN